MNGFFAHLVMRALESPATVRPIVANPFENAVRAAPEESTSLEWPARRSARTGEEASVAQATATVGEATPSPQPIVDNEGSNRLPAPASRPDRIRAANIRSETEMSPKHERLSDVAMRSANFDARSVARASISESARETVDEREQPFVGPPREQGVPSRDAFVNTPKQAAALSRATVSVPSGAAKVVDTEAVTRLDTIPAMSLSRETAALKLQPILPFALRPAQPIQAQGAPGIAPSQRDSEGPRPVHVTIGRVEIRAVRPAPRPNSPARVQRKLTLSLSDYLSHKSGERR